MSLMDRMVVQEGRLGGRTVRARATDGEELLGKNSSTLRCLRTQSEGETRITRRLAHGDPRSPALRRGSVTTASSPEIPKPGRDIIRKSFSQHEPASQSARDSPIL